MTSAVAPNPRKKERNRSGLNRPMTISSFEAVIDFAGVATGRFTKFEIRRQAPFTKPLFKLNRVLCGANRRLSGGSAASR